jgi:phage terminase large subunit
MRTHEVEAAFPEKLAFLFEPYRYKVAYGGRAGMKSWGFSRALLILGAQEPKRILCARETQNSIAQSVHHTLKTQIVNLGLTSVYDVMRDEIRSRPGVFPDGRQTTFIFNGLRQLGVDNIKSIEDVDVCWVEEAKNLSKYSLDTLIPTIRKPGSELWFSFNPELSTDVIYERMVLNPPSRSKVVKIGWEDNPWLSDELKAEMADCRERCERSGNYDEFDNIWGGHCIETVSGAIYANELRQAKLDGRITKVPYDAGKPVHTFWDLGESDMTAIWFAQIVGYEWRVIDYYQNCGHKLAHYIKELQSRPYIYGEDWLPHDATSNLIGSSRTIEEQVRDMGRKVRISPKTSISNGIAAARSIFEKCYFDEAKCADGLQALRHYQYKVDPSTNQRSREPLHNWASHGSDSFRYLAVSLKEGKGRQVKTHVEDRYPNRLGWLA